MLLEIWEGYNSLLNILLINISVSIILLIYKIVKYNKDQIQY